MRACCLDVDCGRKIASLCSGGKDVLNGLKDAVDEAALGSDETSVPVGVVEESSEDQPESFLCHAQSKVGESCEEVLFEVVGDPGGCVGCHDSVDCVEQQP